MTEDTVTDLRHTGCKHLDYSSEYEDCKVVHECRMGGRVLYWERGPRWTDGGNPIKVQFCGQGRGRINGIFQCYNPGEMACYQAQEVANDD